MRVRGAGRGWRTLSRLALIGVIGSGAAACSTDASRLSSPFTNPFSGEPSATGSLGEGGEEALATTAPAIRTPRVQSQELAAPGSAVSPPIAPPMSPRPASSRLAASEPISGPVSGLNPDAGRAMTPRLAPAAPQPKLVFGKGPKGIEKKDDKAEKAAEAKRETDEKRRAEAKKAEQKKAEQKAEAKKVEAKKTAEAEAKKAHIRPGQSSAKSPEKGSEQKQAKAETKPDAKADKKAEAARKAEAEAKLAKAEATKEAARKVAEAKKAEADAKQAARESKQAAKEPAKEEKAAPVKVASADPAAGIPAASSNESFRWPAKGRVINGYGSGGNEGINIAVPEGTPVKAAEEGTVAYAGSDVKGYGKLVLVRHSNGYVSAYAHNGELDVRPGDKVKRGQTIAKSGATGNVTSPQLHFEIRKGATPVDPIPHLAGN